MNGKAPIYLTALAAAIMVAAVLILQPYSVRSPWDAYSAPVRRYLRAALAGDSAALARQSVDDRSVAWALAAARHQPDSVALWARKAVAWAGIRHSDTVDVFVGPRESSCTMVIRFVGEARHSRIEQATAKCLVP